MPDAPDYTLLSDVNVIGGVTLNVNVVGSVTLNVNVTNASLDVRVIGSTVTLNVNVVNTSVNVNITGQAINVAIINPTGVPLYVAQPIRVTRDFDNPSVTSTTTLLLRSVTGRARLLSIVIVAQGYGTWTRLFNVRIRIVIDGVTNDISLHEITMWNGGLTGEQPPAPGTRIQPPIISRMGGWTYAETATDGYKDFRLVIQQEMDARTSLDIYLVDPGGADAINYFIWSWVGFYP
jgi:hypothetical protein